MMVQVEIPIARHDAPTPDHAKAYAQELAKSLALKVSLGGVPLNAAFVK